MHSRSSTPSKIIHVVSSLNVGGAERFVIDLCQVQQKKGFQVSILSLGNSTDDLVKEAGVRGLAVDTLSQLHGWRLMQAYFILMKADILHIHSPHAMKLFSPILGRLRRRVMVYTRHGAAPLEAEHWKRLHKKVRPFINAITFVSEEGQKNFQSQHDWSGLPVEVIDNGIDTDALKITLANDKKKLRLGSVGRMVKLKGQQYLLEAVAALPEAERKSVSVEFFGDGACRSELEAFAEKNLSDTDVVFHGMVGDRDTIYSAFDVLCVTSETEGLSLAVIEAMAFKKAAFATNVGGNPKLVEHGVNGLLFEYADSLTLRDYISQALKEPGKVSAMGEAGRSKVEKSFSLSATAEKFDLLYRQN